MHNYRTGIQSNNDDDDMIPSPPPASFHPSPSPSFAVGTRNPSSDIHGPNSRWRNQSLYPFFIFYCLLPTPPGLLVPPAETSAMVSRDVVHRRRRRRCRLLFVCFVCFCFFLAFSIKKNSMRGAAFAVGTAGSAVRDRLSAVNHINRVRYKYGTF